MPEAWIEKRKTKKGVRRYIRWRNPDGSKGCNPAGPKQGTATKLRNQKSEEIIYQAGGLGNPNKTVRRLHDEYHAKLKRNYKPSTVRFWLNAAFPFVKQFGALKICDVHPKIIVNFRDSLTGLPTRKANQSRCKNGVIIVIRAVKKMFDHAVENKDLPENPASGALKNFKAVPVARFLTYHEKALLLAGCASIHTNPERRATLRKIIRLALSTGLRGSEIRSVDTHRLDRKEWELRVWQIKTSKWKVVPIPDDIHDIFDGENGLIWGDWKKYHVDKIFMSAVRQAKRFGFKGRLRFHDLRHTFASDYLQNGGDFDGLSEILGVTLKTLEIYVHFRKNWKKDKVAKMVFVPNDLGNILGNHAKSDGLSRIKTEDETLKNLSQSPTVN